MFLTPGSLPTYACTHTKTKRERGRGCFNLCTLNVRIDQYSLGLDTTHAKSLLSRIYSRGKMHYHLKGKIHTLRKDERTLCIKERQTMLLE